MYTQKACEKAKMWEVAELSGNFHGELSPPDGGEGVVPILGAKEKNRYARHRVHGRWRETDRSKPHENEKTKTPCTRIAQSVQEM